MSPFHVVFAAPRLTEASARVRVTHLLPRLCAAGIRAEAREIPRRTSGRWSFIRALSSADAVVLHRKLFGRLELAFLRRHAASLVYDFDDAVMFRDPFRGPPASRRRATRFARTMAAADGVVAGNHHLRALALASGARGDVRVIPSGIDPGRYGDPVPRTGDGVVLGWIGSGATLPYLEDILPVLDEAAAADSRFRLRVISDRFPSPRCIPLDARPWSEADEASLLKGIDVGLMPLRDDPWSRGKCGYKILQYFAAGRPAVASPVGVNEDLVRPGQTGFLATTPHAWREALAGLAEDAEARARMGRAGREMLERAGFTLDACAEHLAAFLREIASR